MLVFFSCFLAELNITSASVCMSTIYWSPPPCDDADCTVLVDGKEVNTVPCSNGRLTTSDPDLSSKTLSLLADDSLGRGQSVQVENGSSEGVCLRW